MPLDSRAPLQPFGISTWPQVCIKWALSDLRCQPTILATTSQSISSVHATAHPPRAFGSEDRADVARLATAVEEGSAPIRRLEACERAEPGAAPRRLDMVLEGRLLYRVDAPTRRERRTDFGLRDPAWPPIARLLVAEALHEVPATRTKGLGEACHEQRALLIAKDVEEAGVDDSIERAPQARKVQGIVDEELSGQTALRCLALCSLDS
jgi:hypothetical protein